MILIVKKNLYIVINKHNKHKKHKKKFLFFFFFSFIVFEILLETKNISDAEKELNLTKIRNMILEIKNNESSEILR